MRKRFLKKSEVLHEGYIKGLKKAQRIINEMLVQSQGFDDDVDEFESGSVSGVRPAIRAGVEKLSKENGKKLILACEHGDFDLVKKLILLKADVNAVDEGWLPLHMAAYNGYTEICEFLLKHGADVNAKHGDGDTPLKLAAWDGHTDTCKLLLKHGADVNANDGYNSLSPLHIAAYCGHTEIVSLLLEHGANVNAKDDSGATPLHIAACYGHTEIVSLLLEHGANVNAKNNKRETAYDVASENGKKACCRLLKQHM